MEGLFQFQRTGIFVFFMGFAGSGKTTLTSEFTKYLHQLGHKVATINLDPGVELLPYEPDFDVRSIVSLKEVMRKEKLGPNGGLIRAIEILVSKVNIIAEKIKDLAEQSDWIILDTTGQLELFTFKELGESLISELGRGFSIGVFLIDATGIKRPSDIIMSQLIALAVKLKLDIEVITVINKVDRNPYAVRLLETLYSDIDRFRSMLDRTESTVLADLASDILGILPNYLPPSRIIGISAKIHKGFDELFDILHEIYCTCGDLT